MPYKKTIVCLANSRKLQGRCVAGLEMITGRKLGDWIRPIGATEKGELYAERLYSQYRDPKLLDIIEIEFLRRSHDASRPEDHLVNSAQKWVRVGDLPRTDLNQSIETVEGYLWSNGGSTSYGLNDKVPADEADTLTNTLKLVQPDQLKMRIQTEGRAFGKPRRKVRGHFSLAGINYILAVTDPVVESGFAQSLDGAEVVLEKPILCLSVSEIFETQNACYKLVAGII